MRDKLNFVVFFCYFAPINSDKHELFRKTKLFVQIMRELLLIFPMPYRMNYDLRV